MPLSELYIYIHILLLPDSASDVQIKIAVEENMTLAVESARAIGCHITDEDVLKIVHHDQETIHKILLKFLQVCNCNVKLIFVQRTDSPTTDPKHSMYPSCLGSVVGESVCLIPVFCSR